MSEGKKYFIQDTRTYVGNCVSWWRPNGAGYCCDIDEAGQYTAEEALDTQRSSGGTHKAWPVEEILPLAKRFIDAQRLPGGKPVPVPAARRGARR